MGKPPDCRSSSSKGIAGGVSRRRSHIENPEESASGDASYSSRNATVLGSFSTVDALWRRLSVLAVLLCIGLFSGCHRSTRPALGLVHGRVTLDGKPLADAIVTFTPEGRGRNSTAFTNSDGTYSLNYIRDIQGAAVGWHTVRISTGDVRTRKPELAPERYNTKSGLRIEVVAGENAIDFPLASK
jgi:hypothetical protein